jgi:hypothetical protein
MMDIFDSPIYQGFVQPMYCKMLLELGINTDTPFVWKKIPNGAVILFSLAFDEDDYYSHGQNIIQEFKPEILPAFQLMDMQRLLPDDWYMEKCNKLFRLICSAWDTGKITQGQRLPDVFAMMVVHGLNTRKIHPVDAIEIINQTT